VTIGFIGCRAAVIGLRFLLADWIRLNDCQTDGIGLSEFMGDWEADWIVVSE
jgi:hypothetical protein